MLTVLALICIGAFTARLLISSGRPITDPETRSIVLELRLLSAVTGLLVGALLGTSGVYLQSMLRNPLASPYILGLAAGAGLGVAAAQFVARRLAEAGESTGFGVSAWIGGDELGALAGSIGVLFLVYSLSQRRGLLDPVSLLLVGVMISAVCGALIMLLQFLSPAPDTDSLVRWMMGTISQLTQWRSLLAAGVIAVAGIGIGLYQARALDVAALSDDEARSIGVNVERLRLLLFLVAGTMTAAAVVLAGPIGFVGLVAPHLTRIAVGPKHRGLIIGSALFGAGLVMLADTLVRLLPRTHGLMPIGILTAGIGGPVFIWLLRRERHLRAS